MKRVCKAIICLVMTAALMASFAGCAKMNYITNKTIQGINEVKSGDWKNGGVTPAETETKDGTEDVPVIDAFQAGTYGGVEFKSIDDVVSYYAAAFNKTKAKTAKYKDKDGNTKELYAFLCSKEILVTDIKVDGKENAVINKLIPQLLGALYIPTLGGLQPCMNEDPKQDVDENGKDLLTCRVTADDLLAANVKDNGDGTITLTMQPKLVEMSRVGLDAQGNMFTSLNDIGSVVEAVDAFSWSSGTTEENVKVTYKGGTAVVTIDTKSGEVVKAFYDMKSYASIQHANIAVVHDKSMTATIDYNCEFPASKEFYEKVGVTPL